MSTIDPTEQPGKCDDAELSLGRKTASRTRIIATIPATGFLIAAVALAVGTMIALVLSTIDFITYEIDLHKLALEYVEYADTFLLAVALYIMSIGLTSLFISDKIPMPAWLTFNDFDDLKERLVSVIVVMIGVYFLGQVLSGNAGLDILWLGLSCAAVIIALSVFVKSVFKSH
ncbi:MAG: YqhA family protein [Eggerthellaceae bacterium]|nr:YqhA family protein [Eggerthellaceae bacterium]